MSKLAVAFVGAASLMLCSCGGPSHEATYPVTGRILVDGQPMAGIAISAAPAVSNTEDLRSTGGHTDAEGHFQLQTFKENDGAPNGDYRLTFRKRKGLSGDEFNGRYQNTENSQVKFKVEGQAVDLGTIELTMKPPQ
jgi:hypothetical protein